MQAIVYRSYGGPEVLELADLPVPEPGPGQLLVRVFCTSVNPLDLKAASGRLRPILRARFPQVPGYDVAGEVVRCAAGVTGFPSGSRVHTQLVRSGGMAEFALANAEVTVNLPDGMDFATAAGLPMAGMTALQGLRDRGDLPLSGTQQRVLVIGASGGVGHLAVQIACAAGATVTGICSARNGPAVLALGASAVVDHAAPDPYRDLAPFDVILDCAGQAPGPWMRHLTAAGRFACMAPGLAVLARSLLDPFTAKKVRPILLRPRAADLRLLDEMVTAGKLRVVVDQRFPLTSARGAWERSIAGRAVGKVLVDVV